MVNQKENKKTVTVKLNGETFSVKKGTPILEIIKERKEELLKNKKVVAAEINGNLVDLYAPINNDAEIKLIPINSEKGLHILRHSAAHLLANAVTELYPTAKPTIGPPTEDGFFYDFDMPDITEEDLKKIEQKMKELAKKNLPIRRKDLPKEELIKLYQGKNEYKVYMIEHKVEDGTASAIYEQGNFFDLCRGPHVPSTGYIKAFKLAKLSKAYWLGDAKNKQLTRIYGYCFPTKDELKAYLKRLEEAEKRQHQKLGRQLDLFFFNEVSPGSPFFYPRGAIIYNELLSFLRKEYFKRGYEEVITPQVYKKILWETSKHWTHYRENMFLTEAPDGSEAGLKPMNCPGHILMYKTKKHSYRELPIRYADFGVLHRKELTGTLQGLFRVIKFSQDDSHIFCRVDQVKSEIKNLLEFINYIYKDVFGFDYHIEFSTKPEKAAGPPEVWEKAEAMIEEALRENNIDFKINPGDGAFYGPKIDFHLVDALGRTHQCGTIQLDFVQPLNFDVTYTTENNTEERVVIIHRAILGSIERFMGIMIEHFAGKFPVWLSPVQVRVMNITDAVSDYCKDVHQKLRAHWIRADLDISNNTLNKKVRIAQKEYIPYMIIIGNKEKDQNKISIRDRTGKQYNFIDLDAFIKEIKQKIDTYDRDISLSF